MATPSPMALSAKASRFLVLLGAPLVLLPGRNHKQTDLDWNKLWWMQASQTTSYNVISWNEMFWINIQSIRHLDSLSWYEIKCYFSHLSLHCIDYIIETTPLCRSARVLSSASQESYAWYDACSVLDGIHTFPSRITSLSGNWGSWQRRPILWKGCDPCCVQWEAKSSS